MTPTWQPQYGHVDSNLEVPGSPPGWEGPRPAPGAQTLRGYRRPWLSTPRPNIEGASQTLHPRLHYNSSGRREGDFLERRGGGGREQTGTSQALLMGRAGWGPCPESSAAQLSLLSHLELPSIPGPLQLPLDRSTPYAPRAKGLHS